MISSKNLPDERKNASFSITGGGRMNKNKKGKKNPAMLLMGINVAEAWALLKTSGTNSPVCLCLP